MSSAVVISALLICDPVKLGLADLISAAIAAACGAAAEVPQKGMKPGVVVVTQSVAARSTLFNKVPPLVPNKILPDVICAPAGV